MAKIIGFLLIAGTVALIVYFGYSIVKKIIAIRKEKAENKNGQNSKEN